MNPYDNPVPAPNYAAPLINFGAMNQQQGQQGQQQYSLKNPRPGSLADKLMQYLNPPQQDLSQPLPGSLPLGQGGIGSA